VLSQFAEAENITVEDADVDAELQTMAGSAGEQAEALLRILGTENGRETIRRSLLTRRTLTRLIELAGGEASSVASEPAAAVVAGPASAANEEPEAQTEAVEEAPAAADEAPKPRRSGPRSVE
jgi:hypothetical protein